MKKSMKKKPVKRSKRAPKPRPPYGSKKRFFEAKGYVERCRELAACVAAGTIGLTEARAIMAAMNAEFKAVAEPMRMELLQGRVRAELLKEWRLTYGNQKNRRERDVGYGNTKVMRSAQRRMVIDLETPPSPWSN